MLFPVLHHLLLLQLAFLLPTTVIMHNFWDLSPGSPAHQIEFINFMKVSMAVLFADSSNLIAPHSAILPGPHVFQLK